MSPDLTKKLQAFDTLPNDSVVADPVEILPGSVILLSMKKCDQQVCLKLAGTLRAAIRGDATARERSESWVIRRILIEHYAQRVVDRSGTTNMDEAA